MSSLMRDVEEAAQCSLTNHQLLFQNKPLVAVRHGKQLTLRDYRLKKEETLFISKIGFYLDISNPKVCSIHVHDFVQYLPNHADSVLQCFSVCGSFSEFCWIILLSNALLYKRQDNTTSCHS